MDRHYDLAHIDPPIGTAFVAFTTTILLAAGASFVERRTGWMVSDELVAQLGMVGTTVFIIAGLLVLYRAFSTNSVGLVPIAVMLLGPGALWCWLAFVADRATGGSATFLVLIMAAAVGILLLAEGLSRARWLGVFCGLGAVGLSVAAGLVNSNPDNRSTVSLAFLVAMSGMACLYGTLVEVESSGRRSFEELLDAKQRIEAEIAATEDVLHDLRSGLLSIETAMVTLDDEVSGPLRSETARLRRLTAKRKRNPVEFDMVPAVREMVKARRTAGVTIDLRAPTAAQVVGDESEVMAIVDNLISNAMRHGKDPIHIAIEEHDGEVKVEVADSGRLIDTAQANGMFKRGVTTHADGNGIGLDRARMLAELHRGSVVYDPGSDGTTTFVFTMPSKDGVDDDEHTPVRWTPAVNQ